MRICKGFVKWMDKYLPWYRTGTSNLSIVVKVVKCKSYTYSRFFALIREPAVVAVNLFTRCPNLHKWRKEAAQEGTNKEEAEGY
jgi:hypothetical protein